MFRKITIALLVLLQLAVPAGMAAYRPADEDTVREKGTRYTLAVSARDGLSFSSPGTVYVSSEWLRAPEQEGLAGRYAVLSTDEDGNVFVSAVSSKKPEDGAYLLYAEAERIGSFFSIDAPPETLELLRKGFRQIYSYEDGDVFRSYEFEQKPDSPPLSVVLFVYRGHAALGELLIDGTSVRDYQTEDRPSS